MNDKDKIYRELRTKFDGSDPFVAGGHRDIKIRRGNRPTPEWVSDTHFIRKVLLRSFPKLNSDPVQRLRAGRWVRVIQLYFRKQMTHGQICYELGKADGEINGEIKPVSLNLVKMIIHQIKNAAKRGPAKRGRPKGKKDSIQRARRLKIRDTTSAPYVG